MKKIFLSITILLAFGFSISTAQTNWQVLMNNGYIYTNVELIEIKSDSLVIRQSGLQIRIPLDSVFEIRQSSTSNFWTGAAWGGGIGFGLGNFIGVHSTHVDDTANFSQVGEQVGRGLEYGAVLGTIGGLIGGVIGLSIHDSNTHNFSQMDLSEKKMHIEKLINASH